MTGSTRVVLLVVLVACGDAATVSVTSPLSGGQTSVFDTSRAAFSRPVANLTDAHRDAFFAGNALFNRAWVTAPSSVAAMDGLGPTFNADSCSACHFKDGRGAPPQADEPFLGLLLRLSVPGQDAHGGPLAEPNYGGQLNHRAIHGVPAEASARVTYAAREGAYDDGEPYTLRVPRYAIFDLAFGPLAERVMVSPRVAPAMHGLGLLEAVEQAAIEAHSDPYDENRDGISGRANHVWDERAQKRVLGRFGWKANQPTLAQQSAGAFLGDMGITTSMFPEENCQGPQLACAGAQRGGTPELEDAMLDQVVTYVHLLAVPARRDVEAPQVRRGEALFGELGCALCHVPRLATGEVSDLTELSQQSIHPYTDLLLHDMGEALSDARPDYEASGSEWRTPPLWGIGLVETVNRNDSLLHDGRARGLAEAILWHGGEGRAARDAFAALSKAEREALLSFLRSL